MIPLRIESLGNELEVMHLAYKLCVLQVDVQRGVQQLDHAFSLPVHKVLRCGLSRHLSPDLMFTSRLYLLLQA